MFPLGWDYPSYDEPIDYADDLYHDDFPAYRQDDDYDYPHDSEAEEWS